MPNLSASACFGSSDGLNICHMRWTAPNADAMFNTSGVGLELRLWQGVGLDVLRGQVHLQSRHEVYFLWQVAQSATD